MFSGCRLSSSTQGLFDLILPVQGQGIFRHEFLRLFACAGFFKQLEGGILLADVLEVTDPRHDVRDDGLICQGLGVARGFLQCGLVLFLVLADLVVQDRGGQVNVEARKPDEGIVRQPKFGLLDVLDRALSEPQICGSEPIPLSAAARKARAIGESRIAIALSRSSIFWRRSAGDRLSA